MSNIPVSETRQAIGQKRIARHRADLWFLGGALSLFVVVVSFGYGLHFEFVCRDSFPAFLCHGLSLSVPRVLSALVVAFAFVLVRRDIAAALQTNLRPSLYGAGLGCLGAGVAAILLPLILSLTNLPPLAPLLLMLCWLCGLVLAAVGFWAALFDPAMLHRDQRRTLLPLLGVLLFGLVLPDLALVTQPFWKVEAITNLTFNGVIGILQFLGQDVSAVPAIKALTIGDFSVLVGPQCSGVEGFALIILFTGSYLLLFRKQLILRRALLLLPIALCLSWCLNVVRITVLMLIGHYISPDLAVDGFHSHAGWLAFLVLALAIALVAHRLSWLQRGDAGAARAGVSARPSFFWDPNTIFILPFAVFMASATLTSAISGTPGLLYPVRAGLVAAILLLGWPVLRALTWRIDPLAIMAGLACGVLWVFTSPESNAADQSLSTGLAGLSSLAFAGWVLARVIGTAILVPVVEELFFRGYLLGLFRRTVGPTPVLWTVAGVIVTSVLFGLLHDRVVAGTLAGILFGLITLRRGQVGDAIQSHAAANALIAGAALAQGAWHLI